MKSSPKMEIIAIKIMSVFQIFAKAIYVMEIRMMEKYVIMEMIARILFAHRIDVEHKVHKVLI